MWRYNQRVSNDWWLYSHAFSNELQHYGVKGMKWRNVKNTIKEEYEGVRRFAKVMEGGTTKNGYRAVYNPNGKGYQYVKTKRDKTGKPTKTKWGKKGKTGRIERGMLKVYRMLHPNE